VISSLRVPGRILIIGGSGAGKSTLGRILAQHLGVPYVELDALHHGPNWKAATAQELLERVLSATGDDRGWVVDGNYVSKLGTVIVDRAELIVWLDLPLGTKLHRLARRTAQRWMRNEELWNGNRETLKDAFWGTKALFPWAVRSHFRQRHELPEQLSGRPFVRLNSARAADAWCSEFLAAR
jgi:adenylate kinase family enzyme